MNTNPSRVSPHSRRSQMARALWGVVYTVLFRPSPRLMHGWRRWLLNLFGAELHSTSRIYPRARVWAPWNLSMEERATIADDVDVYCVDRIVLGARAVVSQYSYLCGAGHDIDQPDRPLVPAPIRIGEDCWIAADVFVGPGVSIGPRTVVGARSSVFADLPSDSVCMGSPARVTRSRTPRVRSAGGASG